MIVRQATGADEEACLRMARQFRDHSRYVEFQGPDDALRALFQVLLEHGVIFVAEDEGGVVGMLALLVAPHPLTGARYADEVAWWMDPDCRDGRTAFRLLEAAEEWCCSRHLICLRMVAPSDQPSVARIYLRRGYEAVETSYCKRW